MTKKNRRHLTSDESFSKSTILEIEGVGRLKTDRFNEATFEATTCILFTMLGAFPLLPEEEAMQVIYDSLIDGITPEELIQLGERLMKLAPRGGNYDTLQ